MDTHEDTGFLINHFEPSSDRGNFLNWTKYGDIPSSHGDIPVILCLIYGIGLSATTGSFKISTYWKHFFGCFKFRGCRFHDLYVFYVQIIFDTNLLSLLGRNIIILLSYYQPLPVFSISPTTANSDEPIAFEEHNRWCFENPGNHR